MRKALKTVLIVVGALILLWAAVFITDMIRCNSAMEPLFAIKKGVSADDGGSADYTGIFYTVRVEKHIADGIPCIESIEMRAFGKTVAACIVECTHSWEGEDVNTQSYCNAEVLEVYENTLRCVCTESFSGPLHEGDEFDFSIKTVLAKEVPEVKAGDSIRVIYGGDIMETYPQKLSVVYQVYEFDSNGEVILLKSETEKLTLEKVVELSAKGEKLTWSDFEQYESIDTGSGLFILVYEIDNNFDLMIGGGSLKAAPMYIRLVSKAKPNNYIDIRTENVKDFIEQKAVLKEPPALTVICAEVSIEALRGTTSWIYDNADGTFMGIASDSMHPLQAKEYMTPLNLIPSYLSHIDPFAAYLQWNVAPDKVSVRYWSEDCWGRYDTEGEDIAVKTEKIAGGYGTYFIIELKDGNYIYEVTAEWNRSEKYSGKAYYSFYTIKPDMKVQPIE